MKYWSVKQLADYASVGRSTVQQRADAYAWALSDTAVPGKGKPRRFTPRDVAVMLEVERQYKDRIQHPQIEVSLKAAIDGGEFDSVADFPDEHEPTGMVPLVEHERMMSRAKTLLDQASERAEKAEAELLEARETIAALEARVEELRAQLKHGEDKERELLELHRQIGGLEMKVKMLEERGKRR